MMQQSVTLKNIEGAFAGESMAHAKYRYFAKICRELGDEETARRFEETAAQEVLHAHGHLELLYPKEKLTVADCLRLAIDGETYEYTEMYPSFRHAAVEEGNAAAVQEFDEQIAESKDHATQFSAMLIKAAKRFDALTRVEKRHAEAYTAQLTKITSEV